MAKFCGTNMNFFNKKWIAFFCSFLVIGVFLGQLTEATGGLIPRAVLFLREEEDSNYSLKKVIWKRFPRGSVEVLLASECEDGRHAFFDHVTPKNHSEENHKGTSVLYYFWNGEFFKVSRDDTPSPHLEEAFLEKGFALWSYAVDQSRNFCIFDVKKRTSEVVARGFGSLLVEENRRPLAGVKVDPEIMGFYVNTVKKGWVLIDECSVDLSLTDPFIYDNESKTLWFYSAYLSGKINLECGEKDPSSMVFVDPEKVPRDGRWSIQNGFRCFRKLERGLSTWDGDSIFNFLYRHFCAAHTREFQGKSFSVLSVSVSPKEGLKFVLNTDFSSQTSGRFDLETETLHFDPEPEDDQRLAFRDCLSAKIYGEMDVPLVYGVPDYLFKLSYYVSYPTGGQPPFPAVALVHGGPSMYDSFGPEGEVAHLTSRGYAVVQVNFRGSIDNSERMRAGIGYAGDSMQRDVIQVLDHLISHNQIDAENIAIMGGSYGGYAAMVGATRGGEFHTDLFKGFKCAIAYFPTSSLLRTVEEFMDYNQNRVPVSVHLMAPSILKTGAPSIEDRERLLREAPLTHAASLNIPLLLVHGKYDTVTPIAHALDFAQVCDQRFLEGLIVVEEGHGWQNFGNGRAIYYATELFLKKYLHGGEIEPLTMEDVLFTDMKFIRGAQNFPELQEMLEKYRGFGNLHLSVDALNWLFSHPQRYAFPYPQYFAHEGNALIAPRRNLRLKDLYRVLKILCDAPRSFGSHR